MEQENVRSLKETQQREGEVNEEELKGAVGGVDDDMSVNVPQLAVSPIPTLTMEVPHGETISQMHITAISPIPTFKVEEPEIKFDMEGKPSKNLF